MKNKEENLQEWLHGKQPDEGHDFSPLRALTPITRARSLIETCKTRADRYNLATMLMSEFGITRNAARRYVNYALRPLSGNRGGARVDAGRLKKENKNTP